MTRDEVIQLLGWRLGNRKDMGDRILVEMDFVQRQVLEAASWHPWFLESEWANALTTAGERRVPLPPDFLGEIEESHLYLTPSGVATALPLAKKDMDVALALRPGDGQPELYALAGDYYHFFPKPDDAYALQMRYYQQDTLMSAADVETRWLRHASDLVVAEIGKVLAAKHLQNGNLAADFANDAQVAWKRLLDKHTAMMENNASRSLGGNT